MRFSIIVSTFDHADILELCLRSLARLKFPKEKYEIILVDNNPENPKRIPISGKKGVPKLKTVFEETAGLARSRNRGIDESSGEFIAFIDDDALIDENYLSAAQMAIGKHPEISIFGGPIYPFYIDKKPFWFKDEYESRFWGENERTLKSEETFSGSNMIINRDLFVRFGKFRTSLGMRGRELSLGEETEFFTRLKKRGIELLYIPHMKVKHLVHSDKMTVSYQLKRAYAAGSSKFVSLEDDPARANISFVKYAGGLIILPIWALVKLLRHKNLQQWLVEEWSPVLYMCGYIIMSAGIKIKVKR